MSIIMFLPQPNFGLISTGNMCKDTLEVPSLIAHTLTPANPTDGADCPVVVAQTHAVRI